MFMHEKRRALVSQQRPTVLSDEEVLEVMRRRDKEEEKTVKSSELSDSPLSPCLGRRQPCPLDDERCSAGGYGSETNFLFGI